MDESRHGDSGRLQALQGVFSFETTDAPTDASRSNRGHAKTHTNWMIAEVAPDYRDSKEYQTRMDAARARVTEYVDNVGIVRLKALKIRFPEWADVMEDVVRSCKVDYNPAQAMPSVVKAHDFRFQDEKHRQKVYADMCDGKIPKEGSWKAPERREIPKPVTPPRSFNNTPVAKIAERLAKAREAKKVKV